MPELRTEMGAALVYCRVSTKALAEGTSLESQKARCVAHAESLGYSVARVTMEAYSGAELFERSKLSRDRADIREGKYQALVTYSVDRLTRDEAHLSILRAECGRASCRLVFVTGGAEDTLPREAYAAKAERRNVIERMSRGRHTKLLQGRPVFNGTPLYGYRPDREAGVYRIYEPEAEVVRRVFAMCAGGSGMHRIASTFNREGLPSPKSDLKPGSRWTSATVSLLLGNRSYTGEEVCWKTKKASGGRDLLRPEAERVRLPEGVRPAVITRELWEECRGRIAARAAKVKNSVRRPALLRGHIFCAECGAGMVRNHFRRGKYEYLKYRCGSRWRPFATECRGEAVPLLAVQEWAWGIVRSLMLEGEGAEAFVPKPSADLEAARLAHGDAARAVEALLAAAAGDPALRPYAEQAEGEKRRLEKIMAEIEERESAPFLHAATLLRLRELLKVGDGRLTFDEQREALMASGFKAFANGDDSVCWRYEASVP
jgi:DNA invertase Pin-like site-specific DNA recombinase